MGLLAPLVGVLADRLGPRRIIFGSVCFASLGLLLLGQSTTLGLFYAAFLLIALGMSGCTMTVLMTAVTNWFRKKVGIASGIAISGFGFGGLIIPLMVSLIDTYDWRVTMTIIALGMIVILLPMSLLFRHRPEKYGMLPDGNVQEHDDTELNTHGSYSINTGANVRQALKTRAFWLMSVAFTCHVMTVMAVVTHVMPYLSSIGISRSDSSLIATFIPLASIFGRLGIGWVSDRINKKLVMTLSFISMGIGMLCFAVTSSMGIWPVIPFLILFGIGYGGVNAIRPAIVQHFFGRANFGAIFGIIIGINLIGSIGGPAVVGWAYDSLGSYQLIWFAFIFIPIIGVFTTLAISRSNTSLNPEMLT